MQTSTHPLSFYLAELHTLSSIPPNTWIRKNNGGHFVEIAPGASGIKGAQEVISRRKGYKTEDTVEALCMFAQALISTLNEGMTFHKILKLNQEFNKALNGQDEGWGLKGLITTYQSQNLQEAVERIEKEAFEALKLVLPEEFTNLPDDQVKILASYSIDPETKPYCPEEKYTDQEWEEAIAYSRDLQCEVVRIKKYLGTYAAGQLGNQTMFITGQWKWVSKIGNYDGGELYLGALPINDALEELKANNIGAVLTITEVFENHYKVFFKSPIIPKEYANHQIKHLQIPTPDRQTISFELIQRGVEFIHWNLSQGRNLLVHCRAGRGRSALIECCYLIKHQNKSAAAALTIIQEKRPQAGFSQDSDQWKTLIHFERFYRISQTGNRLSPDPDVILTA